MKFDYVYADLQVKLTLQADNETLFGQLTDGQTLTLGQWLYLTLNCFSNTKAIEQIDLIDKHKYDYLKDEGKETEPDGG